MGTNVVDGAFCTYYISCNELRRLGITNDKFNSNVEKTCPDNVSKGELLIGEFLDYMPPSPSCGDFTYNDTQINYINNILSEIYPVDNNNNFVSSLPGAFSMNISIYSSINQKGLKLNNDMNILISNTNNSSKYCSEYSHTYKIKVYNLSNRTLSDFNPQNTYSDHNLLISDFKLNPNYDLLPISEDDKTKITNIIGKNSMNSFVNKNKFITNPPYIYIVDDYIGILCLPSNEKYNFNYFSYSKYSYQNRSESLLYKYNSNNGTWSNNPIIVNDSTIIEKYDLLVGKYLILDKIP